tara:strand:- start:164 stop:613 length:450 start_codon:yes stop_codon:yes gene_type:complete
MSVCLDGAIPELLLAFTAIIPTPELAADLVVQIPDIPVILPNMMLAVLCPELGLPTITLNADFTFDLPDVAVPIPDFNPIIELLIGMAAITMPPLELAMMALDPTIEMPTIPTDIPSFIAEKLPVPPLTADASVNLAGCLVEIVEGFMP